MNKYAYFTLITKEFYLPCIIRQAQRMKYLQSQYPFIVMVSNNMPYSIIRELEKNKILYELIPYNKLHGNNMTQIYEDTVCKFELFNYEKFDKIIFLDADIIIKQNIDYWFDTININNKYIACACRTNNKNFCDGTIIYCKPNKQFFIHIQNIINNDMESFRDDEDILTYLLLYNELERIDQSFLTTDILHFGGAIKLWMLRDYKNIDLIFYTFTPQQFNTCIDKYQDILQQVIDVFTQSYAQVDGLIKHFDIQNRNISIDIKNII